MYAARNLLVTIVLGAAAAMTIPALAADAASKGAKTKDVKAPAAAPVPQVPKLTATQIVEKHVAARGGSQAWKAVQTLELSGKVEAGRGDNYLRAQKMVNASKRVGGKGTSAQIAAASGSTDSDKQVQLPFTLDLKRPNKARLEVLFAGKTAVQVFDGERGWKLRPFLNRDDVEPFTPEETKAEAEHGDLGGPLVEGTASGARVELDGVELVEGRPAYKLKMTRKNGSAMHVWVDAQTFLDVKMDGEPRRMDGKLHDVYVYQRDFRPVQGVMLPFVVETAVDGYSDSHKLLVEKASVNPALDDARFAKPHA